MPRTWKCPQLREERRGQIVTEQKERYMNLNLKSLINSQGEGRPVIDTLRIACNGHATQND